MSNQEKMTRLLDFPYDAFLMIRLEFVQILGDELEAKCLRIVEKYIDIERKRLYQQAINEGRVPEPGMVLAIPDTISVAISHRVFMNDLFGTVTSENTVKRAVKNLETKGIIFSTPPAKRHDGIQYAINIPFLQGLLDLLGQGYQSLIPSIFDGIKSCYHQILIPTRYQTLIPKVSLMVSKFDTHITVTTDNTTNNNNEDVAQAASALAQSTHETANGESDAPTPTLSGHLSGDASDGSEHHVLPAIPGIPGDHRSASLSVDPQIVNGGDNGPHNNNLRDDHNASRHDNRVLDVPRRLEAPPSCEVSEQTPTFSVPPTDEVSLLVLPPNTPVTGRVEREAAPASGAKPQRKPKVATGKTSTIGQSRISAIIDCMDATIQQLTGDPQFCFSRSKKAQDTIWDTLIKDRKEGQGVTPTMLRATITRMYNTPKDPRSGFDWKENMSIAAICNNFDKFSIGLAAKQPPKVAPVELDAEALEEERRRLEFAIKHAERWAKSAPMAQPQHTVVPIVAKGSAR